jgi:putative spermidine/putrescine transport system substrate-binding protein
MKRLTTAVALAAMAALALTGCAKKSTGSTAATSAGKTTVRVLISGDTNVQDLWTKAIVPGFEKANPNITVNVQLDLHGEHDSQNLAKIAAAVKGNNDSGMDLIDGGFVVQAAQAGLLTPADPSTITGLSEVPSDIIKAGGGGGIPYRGSSVLLAYNSTKVPNPPQTLDALLAWIKANKGQFTYNSPKSGGSGGAFVTTVLDNYLSPADQATLRTTYDQALEAKWNKGFAELKSLNPYVYQGGVYPNGNSQVLQLLSAGSISMAPVWSDQFISGQKSGQIPASIKATQISDPSFTGGAAYLGVPKNAANKTAALKLASYVLTPAAQDAVATTIAGYPVIPLDKLPAQTQEIFKAAHPDKLRPTYFSQVSNDMSKAWDDKVPGA